MAGDEDTRATTSPLWVTENRIIMRAHNLTNPLILMRSGVG